MHWVVSRNSELLMPREEMVVWTGGYTYNLQAISSTARVPYPPDRAVSPPDTLLYLQGESASVGLVLSVAPRRPQQSLQRARALAFRLTIDNHL